MTLSYKKALEGMRQSFPRWSDIRKRTSKSYGGKLLEVYAKEYDDIQKAIEEYQSIFFLVNYFGKENDIIDYLYMGLIGITSNVEIKSFDCEVTENVDYFYKHLDSCCLQQANYLLFHKKCLPEHTTDVVYSCDNGTYKVKLLREHIWNAYDEFAKFAGIERYDDETNKALEQRTYAVFKNFANPTSTGLKHAIENALTGIVNIKEKDIEVIPFNKDNIDLSIQKYNDIFEDFLEYNKDVFRAKIWDRSEWQHDFQKTEYMPQAWDKDMSITQDGVGYNDSLKVDYIKDVNYNDMTTVSVDAYKKSENEVRSYVYKNKTEAPIKLTLEKYGQQINKKKIDYKIVAHSVEKIQPEQIYLEYLNKETGEKEYDLEELAKDLYNVKKLERNLLEKNKKYRIIFTPQDNFSDMQIQQVDLFSENKKSKDLRTEYGSYKLYKGNIINDRVAACVKRLKDAISYSNLYEENHRIRVGTDKPYGEIQIPVTYNMADKGVNLSITCPESDAMNDVHIECLNGFVFDKDRRIIRDEQKDSLGYVIIGGTNHELSCRSFSFQIDAEDNPVEQGAVTIIITAGDSTERIIYKEPATVSRTYDKSTPVKIMIQKNGQNPVQISNFRYADYEISIDTNGDSKPVFRKDYAFLPATLSDNTDRLIIRITPRTAIHPYLDYLQIGESLMGAQYAVDVDTTDIEKPSLRITSNCNATLYSVDPKSGILTQISEKGKYITRAAFKNNTSERGYVTLNTSAFVSIEYSSPQIQKKFRGTENDYIILDPGEECDAVTLVGTQTTLLERHSFEELLGIDVRNTECYVSDLDDIFMRTGTSIARKTILPTSVPKNTKLFKITGLPSEIESTFVVTSDTGAKRYYVSTSFDDVPSSILLNLSDASESIAYNNIETYDEITKNVSVVNLFSPYISFSELYVYFVEPNDKTDTIVFAATNDTWSLGLTDSGLTIKTHINTDYKKLFPLETSYTNDRYIISNSIPLSSTYTINGEIHSLKEYMITPEDGIEIEYKDDDDNAEDIVVPYSGVTKLRCSNVSHLRLYYNNKLLSDYSLLEKEGIVIWNDNVYYGKTIQARYTSQKPVSMRFTDWMKLYDYVSYKIEAYRQIEHLRFTKMKNEDTAELEFSETPDKIVTSCTNGAFQALVQNNILRVYQIADTKALAIHNGYIYDNGQEYYFFTDKHDDSASRYKNVDTVNTTYRDSSIYLHIKSTNYLPHSDMTSKSLSLLTDFDFKSYDIGNVSRFNHLTACESLNLWETYSMSASLVPAHYGYGISLSSENGGYAVMEITDFIQNDGCISLWTNGDLEFYIVPEIKENGFQFAKSICVKEEDAVKLETYNDYRYIKLDNITENTRYYLLVSGTSGIFDDLVSLPFESVKDMQKTHSKNIELLHFDIKENVVKDTTVDIEFDNKCSTMDGLVLDSKKGLSTSASLEYGLTKIHTSQLSSCILTDASYENSKIVSQRLGAKIRTRPFYVSSNKSVSMLYIKINDVFAGKYKDFTIFVYGSSTYNGEYRLVRQAEDTNIIEIPRLYVKNYLYVEIEARRNKIIESIETYARYAEYSNAVLTSSRKKSGSFTTKLYDIGLGDYTFDSVDYEMLSGSDLNVSFYIRGARKDKDNVIFTAWKPYIKDDGLVSTSFEQYSMFQFRVDIKGEDTDIKVNKFVMRVK